MQVTAPYRIAGPFWALNRPGGIVVLLHWPDGEPDIHAFSHFGTPVEPGIWASAVCSASQAGEENRRWYDAMSFHGMDDLANAKAAEQEAAQIEEALQPLALEEVVAAGYDEEVAPKIVEAENALRARTKALIADGKTFAEAKEQAHDEEREATKKRAEDALAAEEKAKADALDQTGAQGAEADAETPQQGQEQEQTTPPADAAHEASEAAIAPAEPQNDTPTPAADEAKS